MSAWPEVEDYREWTFRGVQPRFPVEVLPGPGFDPDDLRTWPETDGRLEYVGGRLLYIPPCGELQGGVVHSTNVVVGNWEGVHPGFFVATSEIGMALGADRRGADLGVWRRADRPAREGGFLRVPPILAVEVAGRDDEEGEVALRDKARWYLERGVSVVWLVLPKTREVVVMTPEGESRHGKGRHLPEHPALPDLAPLVDELFVQIDRDPVP